MTAQLRDGPWTVTRSTTKTYARIANASMSVLGWSGWLIALLTFAAAVWPPAGMLLERLLVP